jgi:hypothetical protein
MGFSKNLEIEDFDLVSRLNKPVGIFSDLDLFEPGLSVETCPKYGSLLCVC